MRCHAEMGNSVASVGGTDQCGQSPDVAAEVPPKLQKQTSGSHLPATDFLAVAHESYDISISIDCLVPSFLPVRVSLCTGHVGPTQISGNGRIRKVHTAMV